MVTRLLEGKISLAMIFYLTMPTCTGLQTLSTEECNTSLVRSL